MENGLDINSVTTNVNQDFDGSQLNIDKLILIITILIVTTDEIEFVLNKLEIDEMQLLMELQIWNYTRLYEMRLDE